MKMIYYYLIKLLFILQIETETIPALVVLDGAARDKFCISPSLAPLFALLFREIKENRTRYIE